MDPESYCRSVEFLYWRCLLGFRSVGTNIRPLSGRVICVYNNSWLLLFRIYLLALVVVVFVRIVALVGIVAVGGVRVAAFIGFMCL